VGVNFNIAFNKDNSFVGAVTMEGWMAKPECFKFIERELQFDLSLGSHDWI
jgi:hypothetical protein